MLSSHGSRPPSPAILSARMDLLDGDPGTEQTIALLRQVIQDAQREPRIRATAIQITRGLPANDVDGQAGAIFAWVHDAIDFRLDPVSNECIQDPRVTLEMGAGDCDDMTGLICALCGSIGIPSRMVTVATDPECRNFTHIYPEYLSGSGAWIALDAARSGAAIGRVPEQGSYHRLRVWYIDVNHHDDVEFSGQSNYPGGLQKLGACLSGLGDVTSDYGLDQGWYDISDPASGGWSGPGSSDLNAWSPTDIIQAITAGGAAASNIIRAFNTTGLPVNLATAGYRMNAYGQLVGPGGQVIASATGGFTGTGFSSSTVVLGIGALGVVLILSRGGR